MSHTIAFKPASIDATSRVIKTITLHTKIDALYESSISLIKFRSIFGDASLCTQYFVIYASLFLFSLRHRLFLLVFTLLILVNIILSLATLPHDDVTNDKI